MKCPICGGNHNMTGHYASANKPVLAQKEDDVSTNKPLLAQSWREKNRSAYNGKQRELMRERRRKLKYDSEEECT